MTKNKIILLLAILLVIISIISVYKLKSKNHYYQKVISTMRIEHEKTIPQELKTVFQELKSSGQIDIILAKNLEEIIKNFQPL